MGSLTSRPKVPAATQPQIVYVPAPQPVYTPAPSASYTALPATTESKTEAPTPTQEERDAEARTQNLLTRDRSRSGTITTSFRGLLGLATGGGTQPKTLLGE
ncbi:MAG: hypothetical protein LRY57_03000 [Alphaproteobacteria bacterium]|nr:hypothetical protein [Alphaproteobacteria bacterium]